MPVLLSISAVIKPNSLYLSISVLFGGKLGITGTASKHRDSSQGLWFREHLVLFPLIRYGSDGIWFLFASP